MHPDALDGPADPRIEQAREMAEREKAYVPPWHRNGLHVWSIVGMNHYHAGGQRRLYVSMTWRLTVCITAEGLDGPEIWDDLARQAREALR